MVDKKRQTKSLKKSLWYFGRVFKMLAQFGKIFIALTVFTALISSVVPSITVLIMQDIINTIQLTTVNFSYILWLLFFYVIIDFISEIITFLCGYCESIFQMKILLYIETSILEKMKEFSLKDFEDAATYDLIQRASNFGSSRIFIFYKSFILATQYLVSTILFTIILFKWKWWIVPVILLVPILKTLLITYFGQKQYRIKRERVGDERKQKYMHFLLTNDIAFKEIKIFDLGKHLRDTYKKLGNQFLEQDKKILTRRTIGQTILLILDQIISTVVFVYIIVSTFQRKILLGNMITYTKSISSVTSSVQVFLGQISSIYENMLYISQYFEFIDEEYETKLFTNIVKNKPFQGIPNIKIKNLSYQYKGVNKKSLNNIDLTIDSNSLVALIGKNGSGKTTLIKILSTLYFDYEGDIYFGSDNLRDVNPKDIQKKIGILFQDFVHYQLTARENVCFGQLEKKNNSTEIFQILQKMGLGSKIKDLEMQLGHWFDEGVQLSGGEWLKVALSRAFIRDADLYLLDEPNAALDPVSEREILKSFKELTNGKIGIIVSHRIASIKNIVDKIVVVNEGIIEAQGSHDELMAISPTYRELYLSEKDEENI